MKYFSIVTIAILLLASCDQPQNEVILARPQNEVALDTTTNKIGTSLQSPKKITIGETNIEIISGKVEHLELSLDTAGNIKKLNFKRYDDFRAETDSNKLRKTPTPKTQ